MPDKKDIRNEGKVQTQRKGKKERNVHRPPAKHPGVINRTTKPKSPKSEKTRQEEKKGFRAMGSQKRAKGRSQRLVALKERTKEKRKGRTLLPELSTTT